MTFAYIIKIFLTYIRYTVYSERKVGDYFIPELLVYCCEYQTVLLPETGFTFICINISNTELLSVAVKNLDSDCEVI
jgi:hypothetical protein